MDIKEVQELLAVACDRGDMTAVEKAHPALMSAIVTILAHRED